MSHPTKEEISKLNDIFNSFPKRPPEFVLHLPQDMYDILSKNWNDPEKLKQSLLKRRLLKKYKNK